ncbi:MAG: hypothetical protein ACK4V1_01020 [Burkholderiaceae bacterium]
MSRLALSKLFVAAASSAIMSCSGSVDGEAPVASTPAPSPTPTPPPAAPSPSPAPPPAGSADFATRCAQPGVVKCVGFDDVATIAGKWGDPSGITVGDSSAPTIDATVKASGAGSLKFTIPSNSGSDSSGTFFTNFASDLSVQFGGDEEFYVQWRQRFSPELIATKYQGAGGFKQIIVGTGDQPGKVYSSCSDLEVVMFNYEQEGFPAMYNSCSGSKSHDPYDGFYQPFGAYDFKLQNGRPSPYCLYSQGNTSPKSYFAPQGNCFGYVANEWMTFQLRIKLGPRVGDEFVGSQVTLWVAREGQPSQLVIDWGPYNLTAGPQSENQRFGKLWLLPYNTGKSPAQSHPTAYTWYDELIVSRVKIPDPR